MGFVIRVDEKPVRLNGRLPLLPLRDVVIFPRMTLPLFVGRPHSVAGIERASGSGKLLFALTQRRPEVFSPTQDDLYDVGTIARLLQVFRLPDGTMRILVEGLHRGRVQRIEGGDGWLDAEILPARDETDPKLSDPGLLKHAQLLFQEYARLGQRVPEDALLAAMETDDPLTAAYHMSAHLLIKVSGRQELLEAADCEKRLSVLSSFLTTELEILRLERKIEREGQQQGRSGRRRTYGPLFEKEPSRKREPEGADGESELDDLERQIQAANMPRAVEEKALRELDRLGKMAQLSPEATVTRTYIDWLVNVPWRHRTRDRIQVSEAERILEEDHHGLSRVKDRVIEHLAVMQLSKKVRGPVLCLVGPPGVGKTSLGRSIARALHRKFVRMSLGGVRDEAEIRGHRRTYIGSMPGRIVQAMRRAGTINPVLLLDEIDKLGADYRGDPASALLEVLDPEQNTAFNDHYLEVDYDLSHVLFLTTANTMAGIPPALIDRMEVIRIPGYHESEKKSIATRFLLPRQLGAHGLKADDLDLSEDAIHRVLREYTREAGVRGLERNLAALCRKVAREKAKGKLTGILRVEATELETLLGPPPFSESELERGSRIGVATGLAWTEFGGDILMIEARVLPGRGRLLLTGKLGETMRESAQAALSFIRSRAERYGLDPYFHRTVDLHIHVPEGAVPKDGPSAGVTIALAMISALTETPTRASVAVTGEITLRGRVLPVGGIPEKAVAAYRAGARTMLIPARNKQSIPEIPEEIRAKLRIVPVESVDQVVRRALVKGRVPNVGTVGGEDDGAKRLYARPDSSKNAA